MEIAIFTKEIANELIKRGYDLQRIGGKGQENIFYFIDSKNLRADLDDILSSLE